MSDRSILPPQLTAAAAILKPYQVRWLLDRSPLKLLVKARRVGGTYMVTLSSGWRAVGYDLLTGTFDLSKGQPVNFVSASERQAKEMIKEVEQHLRLLEEIPEDVERAIPLAQKHGLPLTPEVLLAMAAELAGQRPNAGHVHVRRRRKMEPSSLISGISAERIELVNGVEITAFAANPRTVRGFKGHVILDEFGAMPFSQKIWEAASPLADSNLANEEGYTLEVIGTPLGDDNMFYQLAKTDAGKAFSRHRLDIFQAKAQGFPVNIEKVRARCGLNEVFDQEYCCSFLSAHSRYLPVELIDNAIYAEPEVLLDQIHRVNWTATAGLDVANSEHGDPSALLRNYKLADVYWASPHITAARGVTFPTQEAWVEAELHAGVWKVAVDRGGLGRDMAQRLEARHQGRVMGVDFTNQNKEIMATRCKRLFEQGKQRIPGDQDLRRDLLNLRREITVASNRRFDVSRDKSGHGDRAWALMLSQHAAEAGPPPFTPQAQWR